MEVHYIFHVDVNSAFLSWSALKLLQEDPKAQDLRTIPSAVGGDVSKRHGVITAKSIPAKKFGVQTGEPVVKALQKCPQLVLVKSDFQTYKRYSHALMDILRSYTDIIQQASIDEAYLDISEAVFGNGKSIGERSRLLDQRAIEIAAALQREVRESLGFTVNVGISTNKLLAKTASDLEKPDKIHTLFPEEVPAKLWPLPMGELHGCGPASTAKLAKMGIKTVGEAAATKMEYLQYILGEKAGAYIYYSSNGFGSETVHGEEREAKGYSNETTTSEDIGENNYEEKTEEILTALSKSVARRLERDGVFAQTLGVMVKTEEFKRHSRQTTLDHSTHDSEEILAVCKKLLRELSFDENGLITQGHTYRLIGVSGTNLDKGDYRQLSLFDLLADTPKENKAEIKKREDEEKKKRSRQKELDEMMAAVQKKFGTDAIQKGAGKDNNKGNVQR